MNGRSGTVLIAVLVLLLIGFLVILPISSMWMWGPVMMGRGMMGGWGYPYAYGMGWGFMFASVLLPLIFVILVVVGAYLWLTPRREPAESEKAVEILNERYAKGEITKEQYLEMKKHLTEK